MKTFSAGLKTFLTAITPILPYIFGLIAALIAGYFLWGKLADALGIGSSAVDKAAADAAARAQANGVYSTNSGAGGGLLGGATPSLDGSYSQAAAEVIFHPLDSMKTILGW